MVSKTLLTLIEGYNSLFFHVGVHKSFNTESLKALVSNPKGAITIGYSIQFALIVGVIRKEKYGVYFFTKGPSNNDIEAVYKLLNQHQADKQKMYALAKKSQSNTTVFTNTNTRYQESSIFLKDATIHDLVSRIKELGYTGELTPTKNTISF